MSGVITTGSYPKCLWPGLNRLFGHQYNEYDPEWKALYEISSSSKNYEEDLSLSFFGLAPQKSEGNSIAYDTSKQVFVTRYIHKVYALGFTITREEINDNLYAEVAPARTRGLAFSHHQTQEHLGAAPFNKAFSTDPQDSGGDGVSLCNAAHPLEGGTFANVPTNSAGVLQGVDVSEAAFEQAIIDIGDFRDNRNLRIKILPRKVAIPYNLQFDVERILGNPNRPLTADRDINAMYKLGAFPEGYVVNHFFEDPNAWFILTACPVGMRYFEREPIQFESDNDFDTKNGKYSATIRYSFGWSDPRGIYGSPGA